ncbi:SDR family oxidoreductase [Novispirillum itersonii]|uniref:SDR family oxidoreductase n=1 Tax=Novispirillum itersonii TaxID=189 RepID=UPI00036EDABD|nr:SDR family oxidoreductase [Novispirillum itersonii]
MLSSRPLADKVIIVSGASSGIGAAAARLFSRAGARLVLVARSADRLEALTAELKAAGGDAVAVSGDVARAETARQAVDQAVDVFGGLDGAFNNAGITGDAAPVQDLPPSEWGQVIATNLTGAFHAAQAQIPALLARGGGSLVFTSTFVGHTVGFPGMAAYAASKAGLLGLTQVIAAEGGPQGIRANVLMPGGTDTPMGRAVASTPEIRQYVEGLHALKRIAEPEEIARAALFLLSDDASFVTGTALMADGGVSICRS